jgi:hypothetical protein
MEKKLRHLEMIQGVVNRLAHCSFLLKGWSVVLFSALFALAVGDTQPLFVCVASLPGIAFWVLDVYFLRQERLFRRLYDYVRILEDDAIDFSMDTSIIKDQAASWQEVTLSNSLLIFHGTLIGSIIITMVVMLKGS